MKKTNSYDTVNMKKNTKNHHYYPSINSITPFSIRYISYRKQSKEKDKATIDILKRERDE